MKMTTYVKSHRKSSLPPGHKNPNVSFLVVRTTSEAWGWAVLTDDKMSLFGCTHSSRL